MIVTPRNNEHTENFQKILWLISKMFIHLYANFQKELLLLDWMINDKKLAGFSLGGCLMGDFNNRLLFSLLFPVNCFGGQGHDGGGQSRDGVPPVPPLGNPDWCCQYDHSPLNITNPRFSNIWLMSQSISPGYIPLGNTCGFALRNCPRGRDLTFESCLGSGNSTRARILWKVQTMLNAI